MQEHTFQCLVRQAGTGEAYTEAADAGLRLAMQKCAEEDFCTRYRAELQNAGSSDFLGVIHLKLVCQAEAPKFFLPGFLYNRNTADKPSSGRKAFPRIRIPGNGMPESPFWMTRSDRLAEPVSLVYDSGRVRGLAAAPYWTVTDGQKRPMAPDQTGTFLQFGGFTCNASDGDGVSVGYTLGYENAPWLFVQTATVLEREPVTERNAFSLSAGERISFELLVYDYRGEDERAIMRAIRHVYSAFHQAPRRIPGMDPARAVRLLSGAIRDAAWLPEERMYTGFVYDRPGGNRCNKIGSLTWTNGLSVAAPMLMAANKLGDEGARAQAMAFLEQVVERSYNPASGFLYEAVQGGVWSVRGWWYDGMHSGGHSGYLNGQAIYYLLMCYRSEKEDRGILHPEWLTFAAPVVERMNRVKNTDGEYPFAMSEATGAGIEYDSLGSAWCLAATALYACITGEHRYDEGMKRSEQHYFDTYVRRMECYGGPLDTDKAVDSEGILAYIRAVQLMHALTGEEACLEHLAAAVDYETTFKLGYNTPVQVPPLSTVGWSSCGGSITSTANPHIHPMSGTVIRQMRYLYEHTADPYVKSRLEDTVGWSLQTFNTEEGEYGYGRPGWMSERFCFCQGLLTETYPDGSPASTWFALMPWASGSIIEGLTALL